MEIKVLKAGDSVLIPVLTGLKLGNWSDVVRVMNSDRVYVRTENSRFFWNHGIKIWSILNRDALRVKLKQFT